LLHLLHSYNAINFWYKTYRFSKIKTVFHLESLCLLINTSLYPIAKFLQNIISKSISPTRSHIKNSFDLYKFLTRLTIELLETTWIFSLDVTSLFINILLELAIDSVIKRWNYIKRATIPKIWVYKCGKIYINIYIFHIQRSHLNRLYAYRFSFVNYFRYCYSWFRRKGFEFSQLSYLCLL